MENIKITGRTGMLCVLGSPITHSISPAMHNLALKTLGLDYVYLAFDVNTDTLTRTVEVFRELHVRGWNLTMPNKNKMAKLCDRLSPAAEIAGAVNTVVNDNGILTGHTTDGYGFFRAAREEGCEITGRKLTLLGGGGVATSILVQAALDGASQISVFNRPTSQFTNRLLEIAKTLNERTDCQVTVYPYKDAIMRKELSESYLLINGTSAGMAPHIESCPVPDASFLPKDLIVADTIYNPSQTRLLKMAEAAGCHTFNGMYMLLYQGAEAFRLWTGEEMPTQLVKKEIFCVERES